ncbi:ABC transporter ATP-binding protein [Amycolatopsis nigrescens]|uniref:ABC transporter ATP-binding protein n=1 Tax=Amycolatopsis nigrescens TaxID=381445 RepID=UPI00036765E8|nr:ABC transporter ATP-binding protein [Amycolatopsis nigrescens]
MPSAAPEERPVAGVSRATKIYGHGDAAVTALDEVTVSFPRATLTAIMGPSGSGKSTLLHCLAGLDTLTGGTATIEGRDLAALSDTGLTLLRRERIGFVFQSFNLLPTLSAGENITLPLDLAGRSVDRVWFDTLVAAVGLTDRLGHRPARLSGGQQQRVAVARALITRPAVVFADEPTGNLDSRSGTELLELLRRSVRDLDQSVIMVTHDPVAAGYADQVVYLADGRVVDTMLRPTAERVLDRMKTIGGS